MKESIAEQFLRQGQSENKRKRVNSKYRSTKHVLSQVCLVERLFSAGRLVMPYLRANINPDCLELVLFLKVNKEYWLDAKIIDDIFANERIKAQTNSVAAEAELQFDDVF